MDSHPVPLAQQGISIAQCGMITTKVEKDAASAVNPAQLLKWHLITQGLIFFMGNRVSVKLAPAECFLAFSTITKMESLNGMEMKKQLVRIILWRMPQSLCYFTHTGTLYHQPSTFRQHPAPQSQLLCSEKRGKMTTKLNRAPRTEPKGWWGGIQSTFFFFFLYLLEIY